MNDVPMRRGAALWLAWLAFLLAAAVLWLAAAEPAAAQVTTGTVVRPLFLGKSDLNGATVRLRSGGRTYTGSTTAGFWSVSGAPSGATITVSSTSFTPGTQSGDVTLAYTGDFTEDFTLTLELNFSGFNSGDEERYTIPVLANGTRRLVVGSVTGQATEGGGTASFPVSIGTPIAGTVTVAVSSQDGSEGTVSPSTLTFTTSNYATAQTVTVTGVDDTHHDGNPTWQVRLDPASPGSSGDSDYHALANVDVDVTTTDDEALPTATLSLSASSIDESGASNSATVTATLSGASSEAVTLTVSAAAGTGTVATDYSLSGSTLTIAAGSTSSSGTVTVTAVNNAVDAPNKSVTVSASASGGNGVAAPSSVTLAIADDEATPTVTLALSDASIAENGGTSVVSATLSGASSEATTVTVTAISGAFTVPSGASGRIVIAAGSTTSTDTVTITASNNAVHSGDRTVTVSATAANTHGVGTVSGVSLTLEEDESTPTVTLSVSPTSISENRGTASVSATLSGASSEATTVTVAAVSGAFTVPSGAGAADIVIAAGSTTSTDRVTVTAVNNDVDAADNAVTVTGTASNSAGVGTVTGASLTITDDDTVGYVVVPSTSTTSRLQTTEAGGQATFTVKLATQPTGNVVLDVVSSDTAQGTVSASTLTFTTTTWNTAQTVTLTGVDDSPGTADGSQAYTVSVGSNLGMTQDSNYNGLSAITVYARNLDDEFGLNVGTVTGQATEAGGQATFTVALLTQPMAAVTVAVTSRDGSEGRVSPSSLTFSTTTWNTGQTVTVTGLDDEVDDGNVSWNVRLDPSSPPPGGDTDYHALANVDVPVTTQDDDTAGFDVSPTTSTTSRLETTEAGGQATFTVALTSEPAGNVVLDVASADTGEGTVSPSLLTFTAANWETTRTVTVTGANDDVDDGDQDYTATLTVDQSSTADDTYDALAAVTVYAENTDDDTAGLVVAPVTSTTSRLLTTEAGGQATFTVALASEPTGNVVVDVTSSDTAQGTVSASSLTFTTSDWNTAQTVTVTGVDDSPGAVDGSQTYTVTLAVNQTSTADSNYDGLSDVTVHARNLDDEAGVSVTAGASLTTTERGGQATFTVALLSAPLADVTVPLRSSDPGEGRVSPSSLVFTPLNATTAQTVTVTGVDDAIDDGDVAYTIVTGDPSSTDPTYGGLEAGDVADVSVTNEDDDGAPTVALSVHPSSISEAGGAAAVRATLSHPSGAETTVMVTAAPAPETGAMAADFTLSAETTLTIAAGSRRSAGTVTVTAVDNDAEAPAPVLVLVSGTAQNSMGVEGEVAGATLTIEDDEGLVAARVRLKRLNESVLPEVSRASWGSAMAAVSGRLESLADGAGTGGSGAGAGASAALAGFVQANGEALEEGASWREVLNGQSFTAPLGAGEGAAGAGAGRAVTLWGAGDRRRLSQEASSLEWSGDLSALHLGADVKLNPALTGGVGVSWSESRVDYVDRSEDEALKGVHRSRMTTVLPYLGWSSPRGERLWASMGYGTGEIEITDKDLVERHGKQKSDSKLVAFAAGGAMRVSSSEALRVDVKGEGHVTRYAVDGNDEGLEKVSVRTQGLRMAAQGSRRYALSDGGSVSPSAELGLRWDGGDGAKGAGVEVGGGAAWAGPDGRWKGDVEARWLVAHRSTLKERGISGGLRFEPGLGGRGLSLSVEPGWGQVGGGVSRLWDEGVSEPSRARAGAVLETEMGYGVSAFGGFGVATPYTRYGQGGDERRYGLGWRLSRGAGDGFALDVEAWRHELEAGARRPAHDAARAEHGVGLELRLGW